MKPLLTLIILSCISFSSYSSANAQNVNQIISKSIVNKINQRGFSANDPRYYGTLKGISGYLNTTSTTARSYTLAGLTGRSWLSVGLRGALLSRGTFVALAATGAVTWLLDDNNTVKVKIKEVTGEQGVKGFYWAVGADNYATPSEGAQSICEKNASFCQSYIIEQYNPDPSRTDLRTIKFYIDNSKSQLWTTRTASMVNCGTNKIIATCREDYVPVTQEVIKTLSLQDAINTITPNEMDTELSPEVIADVVNNAWSNAASAPGYAGLPFDASRPVTASDIATVNNAGKASVADFIRPTETPDFTLPTDSTVTIPTNPSTSEQVNLGDDPGIAPPELEKIPTGEEILAPLLSFDPLKNSAADLQLAGERIKQAECPRPEFSIFNREYRLETHCSLLEKNAAIIGLIFMVVYSIAGFRIILSA
ncbi:hypothetical protein FCH62_23230 [Salmonella enterica]|nr:hypothetical protein [Salmonella enterica]